MKGLRLPQIIMLAYLALLMAGSLYIGISPFSTISDGLVKVAMNGVLVISLIPMVNCGMGMNFGLPIGVTAGTIGLLMAIQMRITGFPGFLTAVLIGIILSVILGFGYSKILNLLKGNEEIVCMFVGFSFIPLMNIFYTTAPFTNRQMLYPVGGSGLRPKINLESYFADILDKTLAIKAGDIVIPTLLLLAFAVVCLIISYVYHSKLGDAMSAVSENEMFSRLSGINIDRTRTISVIISTAVAAVGICIYSQSYGFVEAYDGPTNLVFPAVSALLIGGATRSHAKIWHGIFGAALYQTTYLLSVPVANQLLVPQMAEILRMLVTNGIILYAFLFDRRSVDAR
jgi:simple sugar transport system permease protein